LPASPAALAPRAKRRAVRGEDRDAIAPRLGDDDRSVGGDGDAPRLANAGDLAHEAAEAKLGGLQSEDGGERGKKQHGPTILVSPATRGKGPRNRFGAPRERLR
jgi:hypothetical protein